MLPGEHTWSVSKGERFGRMVLGGITGVLLLMALLIVGMSYWGGRRVADCREGMSPGTAPWETCASRGDWNG